MMTNKHSLGGVSRAFSHKKALIAFVTGGDPTLETTKALLPAMEKAGADLIEIGIPFSDPIAEGIIIQAANERALKNGTTTDKIFKMVSEVRSAVKIPIVFLTYLNPIYTYGKERFIKECAKCGVEGLIIPDMPFEEKKELSSICQALDVEIISLIAPTSHQRIKMIAKEAEGFVYCVSSMGVTGVRSQIETNLKEMVSHVKEVANLPCAIGFGIATPKQAREIALISDGAIVGSAIVKLMAKHGESCVPYVSNYIQAMKAGINQAYEK